MVLAAMPETLSNTLSRRGRSAFRLGVMVFSATTLGYYALGCLVGMNAGYGKSLFTLEDDRWEISECVYAAAVTLTTVGFADALGTEQVEVWRDPQGRYRWVSPTDAHEDAGFQERGAELYDDWSAITRTFTALAVLVGITFFLYVIAQVTSFFVEGGYEDALATRSARRRARRLSNHVIVCGASSDSAAHVLDRIHEGHVACVVIENDAQVLRRMRTEREDTPFLLGDATEEEELVAAGIERARGLVTTYHDDGMNLVVVVTALQSHAGLRVVSRGYEGDSAERLALAGATVVSVGRLTGMRVASELVRPSATAFLDSVLRPRLEPDVRLTEVPLGEAFDGQPLWTLDLGERVGLLPVALRRGRDGKDVYNPSRDVQVGAGDTLVVIGNRAQIRTLERLLRQGPTRPARPAKPATRPAPAPPPEEAQAGALRDHFVVCGAGDTGAWVVRELYATHRHVAVVEFDEATAEALAKELPGIHVVVGDAQDQDVLREAGVQEARGLAVTLSDDRLNLVVVVTALQAHPGLRIVSLATDGDAAKRLSRAGAGVVSQGRIGGGRMASEILEPSATSFLDRMLSDERAARFESLRVEEDAPLANQTLGEANLFENSGIRVVALRRPGEAQFTLNPGAGEALLPGAAVVVVASPPDLRRLVEQIGSFE